MGYDTKFSGHLLLSRTLTMAEAKQLLDFNEDPANIAGPRPDSYLQWVPSESMNAIVFDGGEKFYSYEEWLRWLLAYLGSSGIKASGQFVWSGADAGDTGVLTVTENQLTVVKGHRAPPTVHRPLTLRRLEQMALEQVTAPA